MPNIPYRITFYVVPRKPTTVEWVRLTWAECAAVMLGLLIVSVVLASL